MRSLVFGLLILLSSGLARAQGILLRVDFNNFTYPLNDALNGVNRFAWLEVPREAHSDTTQIRLVNGRDISKSSSVVKDGHVYIQQEGFTLHSVEYTDVTGDGKEDAIVVLHYASGGTQNTNYVYVYSFDERKPKLLAYFRCGDRAHFGLRNVYGQNGHLVVELFDPKKRSGDCCSSAFIRTRYKWHNGRFQGFGARQSVALQKP
jgi:hypothetical protein